MNRVSSRRAGAGLGAAVAALLLSACGGGNVTDDNGKTASSAAADDASTSADARQRAQAAPTRLPIRIDPVADPLLAGLTIPANASRRGMWSASQTWSMNATNLALLPDGKVLSYGTAPGKPDVRNGQRFDFWDPAGGFNAAAHRVVASPNGANTFGSSAAFGKDGNLVIVGGVSTRDTTLVRWRTGEVVDGGFKLQDDRWYATAVTLEDGRVAAVGGLKPGTQDYVVASFAGASRDGTVSLVDEVLTPGTGWAIQPNTILQDTPYRINQFSTVPGIGISPHLFAWGGGYMTVAERAAKDLRVFPKPPFMGSMSAAAMYAPNKFLVLGGPGELADAPETAVRKVATFVNGSLKDAPTNMAFARRMASATVLPTGDVAVTGGTGFQRSTGAEAVLDAEIWSPATERWTTVAKAPVARVHHSAALLLPNGAVLSSGNFPEAGAKENAEVFYPPYLFRATAAGASELAPRPVITGVNTLSAGYGSALQVELASGQKAARLVLVRSGTVSQGFNNGQRLIELPFVQTGDVVEAVLPAAPNGNEPLSLPPGYYLVHVLDAAGVPSRAVIIGIGLDDAPAVPSLIVTGGVYALRSVAHPNLLLKVLSTGEPVVSPVGSPIPKEAQLNLVRVDTGSPNCFRLTTPGGSLGLELSVNTDRTQLRWDDVAGYAGLKLCAQAAPGGNGVTLTLGGGYLRVVNGRIVFARDTTDPFPFFTKEAAFELVQVSPAPAINQAPVNVKIDSIGFSSGRAKTVIAASAYDTDGIAKVEVFAGASTTPLQPLSFPFPNFVMDGLPNGVTFRARATDNLGAVTWSAPVTVLTDKTGETVPTRVTLTGLRDGSSQPLGITASLDVTYERPQSFNNAPPATLEIYDGPTLVGIKPANAPLLWTPTTVGVHVLTAKARSTGGLSVTSRPLTITVTADNKVPSVAISAPLAGSTPVSGDLVIVSAKPGDKDGYVRRVEFYDGTSLIGTATSSPWSVAWVAEPGPHTLTAKAFDNSDVGSTSAPVTVAVKPSSRAPFMSVAAGLAPGTNFRQAGQPIPLNANLFDYTGTVRTVEFYDGTTLIGTATGKPWVITWTPDVRRGYVLSAKALSSSGVVAVSPVVSVLVSF